MSGEKTREKHVDATSNATKMQLRQIVHQEEINVLERVFCPTKIIKCAYKRFNIF